MRASPFNKKSGSLLAKVANKDTESEELSGSASASTSSPGADEVVEIAPVAAIARPQRANRKQTTYVVSDSDNETDDDDDAEATEDYDFDEEDESQRYKGF